MALVNEGQVGDELARKKGLSAEDVLRWREKLNARYAEPLSGHVILANRTKALDDLAALAEQAYEAGLLPAGKSLVLNDVKIHFMFGNIADNPHPEQCKVNRLVFATREYEGELRRGRTAWEGLRDFDIRSGSASKSPAQIQAGRTVAAFDRNFDRIKAEFDAFLIQAMREKELRTRKLMEIRNPPGRYSGI